MGYYINDIASFSHTAKDLRCLMELVHECPQGNGFIIKPCKCKWAAQETDFFGRWLTPTGFKDCPKMIKVILAMQPLKSIKKLSASLVKSITIETCGHNNLVLLVSTHPELNRLLIAMLQGSII